jgi:hypothetical protein
MTPVKGYEGAVKALLKLTPKTESTLATRVILEIPWKNPRFAHLTPCCFVLTLR